MTEAEKKPVPDEKKEAPKGTVQRIGRCFEIKDMEIGTGSTAKEQNGTLIHYYIELLEDGTMALEMVDPGGEPTGNLIDHITIDDFSKRFKTCSQHDCSLHTRTIDEIEKKMSDNRVKMGEEHERKGELSQAAEKFKRALKFDEDNVKASFGLGMTYVKDGKAEEAKAIFDQLSNMDALFEKENKHVFNKFGIQLRKMEVYDLAISNYEKAIMIDPEDEALYFNLSRAYEKNGFIQKAIEKLKEALELESDFPEAKARLEELMKKEKDMLTDLLEKQADSA